MSRNKFAEKLFVILKPSSNDDQDPSRRQTNIQRSAKVELRSTTKHEQLIYDTVHVHNFYRSIHSASALTLSRRLTCIAQRYAEYLAEKSIFQHSRNRFGNQLLGENLYMEWRSQGQVPVSARTAVSNWYEEINQYDFQASNYSEDTAHFTQIVWKSSKFIGVGIALSKDRRKVYFVTNYYPAGNIINPGYFRANVSPPSSNRN